MYPVHRGTDGGDVSRNKIILVFKDVFFVERFGGVHSRKLLVFGDEAIGTGGDGH